MSEKCLHSKTGCKLAALTNNVLSKNKKKIATFFITTSFCFIFIFSFYSFMKICIIRKTCLCNEYPPKPHFYIVTIGLAGVYLFFLFLLQNIECGYSLEPPRRGGSNMYPQSMF